MKKVWYIYKNSILEGQAEYQSSALLRCEMIAERELSLSNHNDVYKNDYIKMKSNGNIIEAKFETIK